MKFKKALDILHKSSEFTGWHDENKHCYLVHGFIIAEEGYNEWQIGYYDKDKNKITTFRIEEGKEISKNPEADILKDEQSTIREVDASKVKTTFKEAIMIADGFQQEKYNAELPLKKIVVLQHLEEGQVWNITFLTRTYKTLNMKIDSESGKIVTHSLKPLIGFAE